MNTTLMIKIIGFFYVCWGIGFAIAPLRLNSILKELREKESELLTTLMAFIALTFGLVLLADESTHPFFPLKAIGWLSLAKGIFLIVSPKLIRMLVPKPPISNHITRAISLIIIFLGSFLIYY